MIQGKFDGKDGPAPFFVLRFDEAVVLFDDAVGQTQSEAGAFPSSLVV